MLGHPAFIASHRRCNAKREALLTEERIAAISRSVGPDLARLGEMHDVLRVAAWPRDISTLNSSGIFEWVSDTVQSRHEIAIFANEVQCGLTHARHDAHVRHDVGGIGDLDAKLRNA
ncbi:unannotated protein [freshwater metagenome]|uniref:Unannotated protein n=1 Tax=freshwater metagenome TaxID=449393 RepID=A0A6J7IQX2_9ZZZZ